MLPCLTATTINMTLAPGETDNLFQPAASSKLFKQASLQLLGAVQAS
jgi:hypothetical protein